jgi:hypothetical protein
MVPPGGVPVRLAIGEQLVQRAADQVPRLIAELPAAEGFASWIRPAASSVRMASGRAVHHGVVPGVLPLAQDLFAMGEASVTSVTWIRQRAVRDFRAEGPDRHVVDQRQTVRSASGQRQQGGLSDVGQEAR